MRREITSTLRFCRLASGKGDLCVWCQGRFRMGCMFRLPTMCGLRSNAFISMEGSFFGWSSSLSRAMAPQTSAEAQ